MIFRTITNTKLLLLIILLLSLFTSCVSNDDEPKPVPPPTNTVDLTMENLTGTWEVYFFTKYIFQKDMNIGDLYRYTDEEGFSFTFDANGKFYESNVFDTKIVSGDYLIGNKDADDVKAVWTQGPKPGNPKNGIFMSYKSIHTGIDTFSMAWVPVMYDNNFKYVDQYNGTAQGHFYNVDDAHYVRHKVKAPNYYPSDPAFTKKGKVELKDILGTWQFTDHLLRVDNNYYKYDDKNHPQPKIKYDIEVEELKMMFSIEDGVQVYREYINSVVGIPNRVGEFKIVDDVVHMFTRDRTPAGPIEIKSWKLWLDEKSNLKFVEYDLYRDIKDVLQEKEVWGTWVKVK